MNFDGFQPEAITRFSSLVELQDATALPLGVSPLARNVKYRLTGVDTRDGIHAQWGMKTGSQLSITGLVPGKVDTNSNSSYLPIVFDGTLYFENPVGSGKLVEITSTLVSPPAASSLQGVPAFENVYVAFTNLINSLGAPAVFNLSTQNLDPLSGNPVGAGWQAKKFYQQGDIVTPATPVGGNGHWYRAQNQGTSDVAQPAFPTTEGGTVVDGTITWKETTPLMAQTLPEPPIPTVNRSPGAGGFASGRDVYIIVTLVNGKGETDGQSALAYKYSNTSANDRFVVTSPTLALWIQALTGSYAVTGYNVYEADVANGAAAPLISAYRKVNVGAVAIGTPTNVDNTGAGAAPQTLNGAVIVPVGNICAGLRYMIVLYLNRNGYIYGYGTSAFVLYNSGTSGYQLYVPYIPVGPPNTLARILAFTPAGQLSQSAGYGISSAGPYFWIPPAGFAQGNFSFDAIPGGVTVADVFNGITINSTLINDNTTTTATFNFTDDYLKGTQEDVSAFFRKIQLTDVSDIFFSKSTHRMFYAVDSIPSGWYVSLADDPESVYGDTGLVQVSEGDGQLRTAVREFNGTIYLMKQEGGYTLQPSADDPSTWEAPQAWDKSGPCGPRAVDVGTRFMCYVHRSGVYVYIGSGIPQLISIEIPITWSKINWKYEQTIWVTIDDETREILIGVPYGNSVVPNKILKCNYEESPDFARPIHFSGFSGKEIASGECYKWSVDDIPANIAKRFIRPILNPGKDFPLSVQQSQLLFASSNPDGTVSAQIPELAEDNGVGIDSVYETACPEQLMKVMKLGGVQANIGGCGQGKMEVLALRARDPQEGGIVPPGGPTQAMAGMVIPLKKDWIAGVPYSCGARGLNERYRLRITNGARKGVRFKITWAAIYAQPTSSARTK